MYLKADVYIDRWGVLRCLEEKVRTKKVDLKIGKRGEKLGWGKSRR